MFYVASKFLYFFFQPSSMLFIALSCGIVLARGAKYRQRGLQIATVAVVLLLLAGFSSLSCALLLPLENRFQSQPAAVRASEIAGVIILGGFEDIHVDGGRGSLSLNEAGERLTEGLRLARSIPSAKVVFTSNVADAGDGENFVRNLREFMADEGISPDRIVIESHARNTYENASLTYEVLKPTEHQLWALVTSAFHMPRAVGTFRQRGFHVIAYPVDYRTRDIFDVLPFNRLGAGLESLDLVVREWVGLAAYWITGKSDALFPKP